MPSEGVVELNNIRALLFGFLELLPQTHPDLLFLRGGRGIRELDVEATFENWEQGLHFRISKRHASKGLQEHFDSKRAREADAVLDCEREDGVAWHMPRSKEGRDAGLLGLERVLEDAPRDLEDENHLGFAPNALRLPVPELGAMQPPLHIRLSIRWRHRNLR